MKCCVAFVPLNRMPLPATPSRHAWLPFAAIYYLANPYQYK